MHLLNYDRVEKVIHKKVLKNRAPYGPPQAILFIPNPARRRRRKFSKFLCSANEKDDAFDDSPD